MRAVIIPLVALTTLTAACDGREGGVRISATRTSDGDAKGVLRIVDTLQCPQTQGVLTRKGSAQSGGTVCTYTGPRGAEVTLHLVPLDGATAAETLKTFERRLSADLPHSTASLEASAGEQRSAEARAAASVTDAGATGGDHVQVQAPGMNIETQGEKATVRLPGMSIEADGDRANIRIGGLTIRADDRSGRVDMKTTDETVNIEANDEASRIIAAAPGQATRASFVLVDSRPSAEGWRMVGYEARGPVGGPLVIAAVRGKDRNEDEIFNAAKTLVALNVGE